MDVQLKRSQNERRHRRLRRKIAGTDERPRLSVSRSHLHFYVQAIDDLAERTICGISSQSSAFKKTKVSHAGNLQSAKAFGAFAADVLKKKKITKVVFDRGGRPYEGRIRVLAEALRENGIQF